MLTPTSLSDLDHISKPILIPEPINLEYDSPILNSHITLMGINVNLNSLIWTPLESYLTLELKLDLNQFHESVLVLKSFIFEPKSTISPNHISLLDQSAKQSNSEMIYQDWSYNQDDFHVRILHDAIQIGDYNNINKLEVKSEFLWTPYSLNWATTRAPIRPPPEPLPSGNIFPFLSLFHAYIHSFIHW